MTDKGIVSKLPIDAIDQDLALQEASRVLEIEISGLESLKASLDGAYCKAISLFLSVKGRLIVTGMGKSGHIARKIASTLSSTGTPSQYIHPGEASHGDLGMITPNDVVLALSNSGETRELSDLLVYCRRYDIPLVSMTQRPQSTLAKMSDVCLLIPFVPEACPHKLAPTTSSLLMLALGDALAMTLLKLKGFSPQDFKVFHPGGQLGRQLCRVGEIMHSREALPLMKKGHNMGEALVVMTQHSFGCVGIVDQNQKLIGIITDGDLRRHMSSDLISKPVEDIMSLNPWTIEETALAAEGLNIMNKLGVTSLFITDKDQIPIGLLHIHDCLRAGV
jgi:arabinose-5-phosphate isomerase